MRILLISGHGAGDPGATVTFDGKSYEERAENIKVVQGIAKAMKAYEVEVDLYDTQRDAYQDYKAGSLGSRAAFERYQYVLEIHFNACARDPGNGKAKGCEVFYPSQGSTSGAESNLLAALSGFGLPARRITAGQYAVINTAARYGVKADLLEVAFLDDWDDLKIWIKFQQSICEALAAALAKTFQLEKRLTIPVDDGSSWSAAAREWAVSSGLITGTSKGMEWSRAVTREELVTILHRYHNSK